MNNLSVDIDTVFSDDEIKELVGDEIRKMVRAQLAEQADVERVVSNSAFNVVWDAVDTVFDGDVKAELRNQVIAIIKDMSNYNVFKKPDAWSRESNTAYKIMQQAIIESKPLIIENVKRAIADIEIDAFREDIKDNLYEIVTEHIFGRDSDEN